MKVKLSDEQSDFIKSNSSCIDVGEKWYYMPFWFREISDNVFEQVSFENLPQYVKDKIKESRETPTKL